ncbi:MAG: aldo/keto reductase [Actinomycetota bacterium]|nr:aldo/keto reductase [Actinomycetota bacterium]
MRYHTFGASGLRVSSAFLGAMTFGDRDGKGADLQESRRILDAYADAGGNVIDTAVNYRGGESETILGELLLKRRDSFVLATKYTASRDRADPNAAGNHRKNLRLSLDLSLRRLRTDYIDLYWVHMWDRWTPIEETMRALDDEVRAGRLLYIGISDTPAWALARANTLAEWKGWSPFVGLQIPYNLTQRDVERELLPAAAHLGVSIAAWGPLAGGLLSGKYTRHDSAKSTGSTRHAPSTLSERDLGIARLVDDVAAQLNLTASQVAIAWTTARRARIHPILGARTSAQLQDNLAAVDLTLPEDALDRLDAATAPRLGFPTEFIDETTPWVFAAADLGSPQPKTMAR